MAGHAGRGRRFERFRRVVGGIAATLAVATAVVDAPRPATGAPAQTDGPEVTVSPAENLTDGAVLAVTGTGLVPGHRYGVHQCEARTTAIYEGCDFTENAWGEADWPAGSIELWFRADTILTTGRGTTDCRVEDACIVALVSDVGVAATAALHFDPTAEPAPPPRLTVAPEDGLFHGLEVAFESQGFVWGGDITLRQCVTGAVEPDMCDAETARSFPSGLEDRIAGTFAVSAEIHTAERAAVDCREEGACSLVASIAGGMNPVQTASTELRFDPTVPLPEPPQIVAEHNIDLFDGQVIGLSGTGFARGRLVGIYQCGARPHWGNCRLIETVIRPDEAGAFRAEISLSAVLNTAFGQIDCRVSDEACVLVAANGFNPGSPRAAQTTLHFDPDAPLRPTPRLTVSPASGLVDGATVSVEGVGWTRWAIDLRLCAANAPSPQWLWCDSQQSKDVLPTHEGAFRTELHVNEAFASQPDEQSVDCGVTPGCAVVATDVRSGRSVSVPITFEGAAPPRRYLDPVFDGVQATYNVVYRNTVDRGGAPSR